MEVIRDGLPVDNGPGFTVVSSLDVGSPHANLLLRGSSEPCSRSLSPKGGFEFTRVPSLVAVSSEAMDALENKQSRLQMIASWLGFSTGRRVEATKRMQSLDTLMARAICAQVPFVEKVVGLGSQCSASMLVGQGENSRLISCKAVSEDKHKDLLEAVCKGGLKRLERCVEKLLRSYQGDVSRLCDVNRQMLIFDNFSSLVDFIIVLQQDPQVEVVRVKNRFDSKYDSWVTYGYRDVNLNLKVSTEETRMLGVDMQICELQLALRCFADLRRKTGHKQYIIFRNLRGE